MSLRINATFGYKGLANPVTLQCSEDGDLILELVDNTSISMKVYRIELTVYLPMEPRGKRAKKVNITLDQANNRKLLSELIEKSLPFLHIPSEGTHYGYLKAVSWNKRGTDWGDGWNLFGHSDVMEIVINYEPRDNGKGAAAKRRRAMD